MTDEPTGESTRGLRQAPAGGWRVATVRSAHPVAPPGGSPHAVVLRLEVPDRVEHWPGQHYVIRLRAEDGYTAQRSYSVASDPGDPLLEFYVERLADGEVSGFLADEVIVGDELEIRGPIGGWFVWTGSEPMLGVAGGSGVVPIVSMLRHAARIGRLDLVHLAVAARTRAELPYADELATAGASILLSREDVPDRVAGRITAGDLAALVPTVGPCLVCGSTAFTGTATRLLAEQGVDVRRIRIESFGPTG